MSTRPPAYPAMLPGDAPAILSPERFMRYIQAAKGDVSHAIELYEMNIQVSEGVFGVLHLLEITIRNSMHSALTAYTGRPD